jgi:hypothetical protein
MEIIRMRKMKNIIKKITLCLMMTTAIGAVSQAMAANDDSEMRQISPSIIVFDIPLPQDHKTTNVEGKVETKAVAKSDNNAALVDAYGMPTSIPIVMRPAVDKINDEDTSKVVDVPSKKPEVETVSAPVAIIPVIKNATGSEMTAWPSAVKSDSGNVPQGQDEFGQKMPQPNVGSTSTLIAPAEKEVALAKPEMQDLEDVIQAAKDMPAVTEAEAMPSKMASEVVEPAVTKIEVPEMQDVMRAVKEMTAGAAPTPSASIENKPEIQSAVDNAQNTGLKIQDVVDARQATVDKLNATSAAVDQAAQDTTDAREINDEIAKEMAAVTAAASDGTGVGADPRAAEIQELLEKAKEFDDEAAKATQNGDTVAAEMAIVNADAARSNVEEISAEAAVKAHPLSSEPALSNAQKLQDARDLVDKVEKEIEAEYAVAAAKGLPISVEQTAANMQRVKSAREMVDQITKEIAAEAAAVQDQAVIPEQASTGNSTLGDMAIEMQKNMVAQGQVGVAVPPVGTAPVQMQSSMQPVSAVPMGDVGADGKPIMGGSGVMRPVVGAPDFSLPQSATPNAPVKKQSVME